MDRILQCLLWVSLTVTTSAYKYPHNPYYHSDGGSLGRTHRFDYESFRSQVFTGQYDDYSDSGTDERLTDIMNDRPAQRMNERSIAVNSGVQRVQDQERKRLQPQSRTDDPSPRTESGSYKIVNIHPKPSPSVANRRGQLEEKQSNRDSVVFPGPTSKSSVDFVLEIPDECKRIGICERVPNYPKDIVSKVIAEIADKRRFHIDELDQTPEIAQRIGPAEENIELCNYREAVIMPQAAKSNNGKWYVILNEDESPIQGYRVEICEGNGTLPCNENIVHFYDGYSATCKQKFVQRTMTALDDQTRRAIDLPFKVPSCCSCVVSATHARNN